MDYSKQWYLNSTGPNHINAEKAWDLTTGSSKIIVAVIDTGVDLKNPELKENLWENAKEIMGIPGVDDDQNGYIDDFYGYDFVNSDSDPSDDNSHGTHLASIIGAKGNNKTGMTGVTWNVRMMPVKVLDASNSQSDLNKIAKGIYYAVDNGANIINASFALGYNGSDTKDQVIQTAINYAEKNNVLVIAAAGNNGEDIDEYPMAPAALSNSNILTVTASDEEGWRIGFANIGMKSVDVAAPGRNVWGLLPDQKARFWGGTSQATAIASGVAALVLSKYPTLKPNEVRNRIMNSVKKSSKFKGEFFSEGLVDAYKALL